MSSELVEIGPEILHRVSLVLTISICVATQFSPRHLIVTFLGYCVRMTYGYSVVVTPSLTWVTTSSTALEEFCNNHNFINGFKTQFVRQRSHCLIYHNTIEVKREEGVNNTGVVKYKILI